MIIFRILLTNNFDHWVSSDRSYNRNRVVNDRETTMCRLLISIFNNNELAKSVPSRQLLLNFIYLFHMFFFCVVVRICRNNPDGTVFQNCLHSGVQQIKMESKRVEKKHTFILIIYLVNKIIVIGLRESV